MMRPGQVFQLTSGVLECKLTVYAVLLNRPQEGIVDWSFLFFLVSVLFGLGLGAGVFGAASNAVRGEKDFSGWKIPVSAVLFSAFQFGMFFAGYGIVTSLAGNEDMKNSLVWAALFLGVYFGGKMILTGLRDLKKGERDAFRELKAAEEPLEAPNVMTAEEAVPGREITRTRVGDKIPVMWKVFLKAFGASGAAFAAGFLIPKMPLSGAFTEGGIIFLLSLVMAFAAFFAGLKKDQKVAHIACIAGGVLVLAAVAVSLYGHFTA